MSTDALKFKRFTIQSNDNGKTCDVRAGTPVIEYRESVFMPYPTVECAIVDTGNALQDEDGDLVSVLEGVKCQGVDKVEFEIEDSNGNALKWYGDNHLVVSKTSTINASLKSQSFRLSLVSPEAFNNLRIDNECRGAYRGRISDIVKQICLGNLKSNKKTINFDETIEVFSQEGKSRKPFDMILDLQPVAIPDSVQTDDGKSAKGNLAGYLFWQTTEGFCFKSLDKLFKSTGTFPNYLDDRGRRIKKVIETKRGDDVIPPGYDNKILNYRTLRTFDGLTQFEFGAYNSQLNTFDLIEGKFTLDIEALKRYQSDSKVLGGKDLPDFGEFNNLPTMRGFATRAKGLASRYGESIDSQVDGLEDERYSVDDVLQQSSQNYKQKMNMSAEIIIPADFSLHAGDLIYCEFQKLSSAKTVKRSTNRDSGIYMIADLCHYGNKAKTFTGLHLVRDSYGVKSNG